MRLNHFLLVVLIMTIIPIYAQTGFENHQIEELLFQLKQLPKHGQVTESQVREIVEKWNKRLFTPHQVMELTRLLQQDLPEAELAVRLRRFATRRHRFTNPTDLNSVPITKTNDLPLTAEENTAITQVLEDFQVNENVDNSDQTYPAIAVDDSGNFVVVWEDNRNGNWDIYGQRYDSNGSPLGSNLKINADTSSSYQSSPAIAVDGSGNFVMVWTDDRNGQYNSDIYGQRYDSKGSPLGSNFKINVDTGSSIQYASAIDVDGSGNFVVVWQDKRNGNLDIYGQRYNSNGTTQSGNFKINDYNTGSSTQWDPAIAVDSSGNFMVVWNDERNEGTGNPDVYGQRYNSNGAAQGGNFKINDETSIRDQYSPAIAVDGSGNFVVVWTDQRNSIFQEYDIYGQRFSSNGTLQSGNFRINDNQGNSSQYHPAISMDSSGHFVVMWTDERNGKHNDYIYGQLYGSNGEIIGTNYRVNNDTGEKQQKGIDVKLVNRRIYHTWTDSRVPGQGRDIFARIDLFNNPPIAPTLPSPANNDFTNNNSPSLSWQVPADLDGDSLHFKVEIATDSSFTNQISGSPFESQVSTTGFTPIPPLPEGVDSCSYKLQFPLNDETYYWRVSATDKRVYGPPSNAFSFTIDTQPPYTTEHYPAPNATNVPVNTNIIVHVCDSLSGIKKSSIVLKVNGIPVNPDISGNMKNYSLNYTPQTDFRYNQTVNVSIEAADSVGNQMNPDSYTFTTDVNSAPAVPLLVSPDSGSHINNSTPQLIWLVPTDPESDSLHFKVEIATDVSFINQISSSPFESHRTNIGFKPVPPVVAGKDSCSFTPVNSLPNGVYWWRVTAWDGYNYCAPSSPRKFTIDTKMPHIDQISLLNPHFGNNWFNQDLTASVIVQIQYDELHADFVSLNAESLENPPDNTNISSGEDQTISFRVNIAGKPDSRYRLTATIVDSAGNSSSDTISIYLDNCPPAGTLANSPDTSSSTLFTVSWESGSDGNGSGLSGNYDVKVKTDNGDWVNWKTQFSGKADNFEGQHGSNYSFETVAWDNLNNREDFTGIAETVTKVDTNLQDTQAPLAPIDLLANGVNPNPWQQDWKERNNYNHPRQ